MKLLGLCTAAIVFAGLLAAPPVDASAHDAGPRIALPHPLAGPVAQNAALPTSLVPLVQQVLAADEPSFAFHLGRGTYTAQLGPRALRASVGTRWAEPASSWGSGPGPPCRGPRLLGQRGSLGNLGRRRSVTSEAAVAATPLMLVTSLVLARSRIWLM